METDDETGDARRLEELTPGDLRGAHVTLPARRDGWRRGCAGTCRSGRCWSSPCRCRRRWDAEFSPARSEEHTSELQSHSDLVCRLLLEKKKKRQAKKKTQSDVRVVW